MNRQIEYIFENDNGDEITLDVEYCISKYRCATYLQPSEGGEVEIMSIKRNDVEYIVSEGIEQAIIEHIENKDDYSDNEYFEDEEEE